MRTLFTTRPLARIPQLPLSVWPEPGLPSDESGHVPRLRARSLGAVTMVEVAKDYVSVLIPLKNLRSSFEEPQNERESR